MGRWCEWEGGVNWEDGVNGKIVCMRRWCELEDSGNGKMVVMGKWCK